MKIFFDLDPAVYMSAFASQKYSYSLVYEDMQGEMHQVAFKDGTDKNQWIKNNDEAMVSYETHKELEVEDESHARQCAKTTLTHALTSIRTKFMTDIEPEFYLTGKGNFREELATIAKYKGNRDKTEKPVHYQAVRDYFVEEWGAQIIEGIEADDEVSIRAWELWRNPPDEYVIATIDKDLDQIPGWHYDYKKHVFYDVDQLDGELFFYAQILSGDATDNIKGCYRIGNAKATKMVDQWFDEWQSLCTRKEKPIPSVCYREYIWERICDEYEKNIKQFPDKNDHGLSPEAAALENAQLVYMQQRRDDIWTPIQS